MELSKLGKIYITPAACEFLHSRDMYAADFIEKHLNGEDLVNIYEVIDRKIKIETKDGETCISLMEKKI